MAVDYASGATPLLDEFPAGVDAHPTPHYEECVPVRGYLIAFDTEGDADKPWGLSASATPGHGVVNPSSFNSGPNARYVLHNALHDLPVLRAMGVDLPDGSYIDTMVMAYLLRLEWQASVGAGRAPRRRFPLGHSGVPAERQPARARFARADGDVSPTGATRIPRQQAGGLAMKDILIGFGGGILLGDAIVFLILRAAGTTPQEIWRVIGFCNRATTVVFVALAAVVAVLRWM